MALARATAAAAACTRSFCHSLACSIDKRDTSSKQDFRREKVRDITPEAINLVSSLKRVKMDSGKVDALIKSKTSRMIRPDILCVLYLLQQQQEVDLAYKVFEVARKEDWYKPSVELFHSMSLLLAKQYRFQQVWEAMDGMTSEGLVPSRKMFSDAIRYSVAAGDCSMALKLYKRALQEVPSNEMTPCFFGCVRARLVDANQLELAESVRKDMAEFIKLN